LLNTNYILVIGLTNQSHISKGELTMEEFEDGLQYLNEELTNHNAHFDAVYCCPHMNKDKCNCKKPLTGMVDKAKDEFEIDMQKAYVVGDMGMSDMVLARNINAKGILVLTGVGKGSLNEFRDTWKDIEADYIAENVLDAVNWIINDLYL
jgi:D-glycero-D-manno-heptose 1,7-bisphosphate phosphatase